MFVLDGPWNGRSPVDIHREAIALGIAMQEQAGRFFGNGSRPGGVLKSPEGAKYSKEQREELKRSWEEAHRGPANSNRVAVLEGGLEWQQIGLSADDSQFVQSRLFHVAELCRIWNVPPYKVQEYGRATWSNTEQQAIEFLTTCMLPWFRRWEEAIGWYLIDDSEPLFAEFLLEGLLRGDTATRYAAYTIATGGKAWMSPNEIRELENRNRVDGLDEISQIPQGAAPGKPQQQPQKQPTQTTTRWCSTYGISGMARRRRLRRNSRFGRLGLRARRRVWRRRRRRSSTRPERNRRPAVLHGQLAADAVPGTGPAEV
jgi:phage portal protein BeeE